MAADLGIKEKDRVEIVDGLSKLLADTYTLYLKTHNFHWNVTGPMFQTLHLMFETQYNEMWNNVDLIAERIRSLDAPAPGTYAQFSKLASIKETPGVPKAQDMIKILLEGHEAVTRTARKVFPAAESGNDQPTMDLLTQRMEVHEKPRGCYEACWKNSHVGNLRSARKHWHKRFFSGDLPVQQVSRN